MTLRIVVGADSAGLAYKDVLKADLGRDSRVSEVIDVASPTEKTLTIHISASWRRG